MAATSGPADFPVFCGIDVGTQGVRVVLVDASGVSRGTGTAALPPSRRDGVRHEQSPDDWWSAVVTAVREALDLAGPRARVEALALDATSGTVLLEDRDGRPVGCAVMYDDGRAAEQAVRVQAAGAELWERQGYRMQASWALPKVVWLMQQAGGADAMRRAGTRVVHQSDHLVRRLAGRPVRTDTSNALKTGVDLVDVVWPVDVFADLGIGEGLLPDPVLPGVVIALVSDEAAELTGLVAGTPIKAGMTDGCAAQIASGAVTPGTWSSALGTTLVIKGATRELLHDPAGAVYSHRHPDGGWLPGGASSTGAGILAQAFPGADLELLTDCAATLVPTSGTTYPLAGSGERFPFRAPDARGFSDGEPVSGPGRFAALCQGIAYVERLSYDVLAGLGAATDGPVHLTGGTTANRWFDQLRADVLGRPCLLPGSAEAATGMAVLAAAHGSLTETVDRMIQVRDRFEPNPERGAALMPGYRRLVQALSERGWLDADVAAGALARAGAR